MKKLFAVLMALALIALPACSGGTPSTGQADGSASNVETVNGSEQGSDQNEGSDHSEGSAETSTGLTMLGSLEWPENEVTEGVPVPQFSVPIGDLHTSEYTVAATWENVSEEEAAAYVQSLKDAGFTFEVSESTSSTSYSYSACNGDIGSVSFGALRSVHFSYSLNADGDGGYLHINVAQI